MFFLRTFIHSLQYCSVESTPRRRLSPPRINTPSVMQGALCGRVDRTGVLAVCELGNVLWITRIWHKL